MEDFLLFFFLFLFFRLARHVLMRILPADATVLLDFYVNWHLLLSASALLLWPIPLLCAVIASAHLFYYRIKRALHGGKWCNGFLRLGWVWHMGMEQQGPTRAIGKVSVSAAFVYHGYLGVLILDCSFRIRPIALELELGRGLKISELLTTEMPRHCFFFSSNLLCQYETL